MQPKAIVLTGAGINCERETAEILQKFGFDAEIIHIIDLLQSPQSIDQAQMVFFPGGFSYGDHGGAALVLAEQLRRLSEPFARFLTRDTLMMGVCNGCQLLLRLEMFAGSNWRFRENAGGHYECRWVNVKAAQDSAFFAKGDLMPIPVAHGEGQLFGGNSAEIGLSYCDDDGKAADGRYPLNPNGAEADAAGILAHEGRVLAMMPHPERGAFNWQRPDAMAQKASAQREGRAFDLDATTKAAELFANARRWFG